VWERQRRATPQKFAEEITVRRHLHLSSPRRFSAMAATWMDATPSPFHSGSRGAAGICSSATSLGDSCRLVERLVGRLLCLCVCVEVVERA
jgi:hypothetical protein